MVKIHRQPQIEESGQTPEKSMPEGGPEQPSSKARRKLANGDTNSFSEVCTGFPSTCACAVSVVFACATVLTIDISREHAGPESIQNVDSDREKL